MKTNNQTHCDDSTHCDESLKQSMHQFLKYLLTPWVWGIGFSFVATVILITVIVGLIAQQMN